MKPVRLKDLKQGDFFTLKPVEYPTEARVYIRDVWDRSAKKYAVGKFSDANDWRLMKGDKIVYTDFIF